MWVPAALSLLSLVQVLPATTATDCRVYVLRRAGNDVAIEVMTLAGGSARELPANDSTGIITLIVPAATQQFGDLVHAAEPKRFFTRCEGGELQIRMRRDGHDRIWPPVTMADFARYELRVNVVWRGGRRIFLIRRARAVEVDSVGPVIDMFASHVSPGANDYAVSTESTRLWAGVPVSGEAPLLYAHPTPWESGHLLARGAADGGADGYFVVDLAAGRTVISRTFLPPDIAVRLFSGAESEAAGARAAVGSLVGAGGVVEHLVGATTLPALRIGNILFDSAQVLVLDSLSRIGGRPIAGVLGLDLMRRATRVSLSYPRGQSRAAMLTLGRGTGKPTRARMRLPISMASGHVFFRGVLDTMPVDLVLDSGSPLSFLSDRAAIIAGVDDLQPAGTVSGLDGSAIPVRVAVVPRLQLGDAVYRRVSFHVARLPVFRSLGLTDPAGLLGNDFLDRFRVVEVDFEGRVLLLRP